MTLATEHSDAPEVRAIGWLLSKILGDDLVTDEGGNPQIGQGTARDRIVSMTDPDMRDGRKSGSRCFNGFKTSVATEFDSDIILDITDVRAPGSDGAHLMPMIERVEADADVTVEQVIGDGAYGCGDNRAACANYPENTIDVACALNGACLVVCEDHWLAEPVYDIWGRLLGHRWSFLPLVVKEMVDFGKSL